MQCRGQQQLWNWCGVQRFCDVYEHGVTFGGDAAAGLEGWEGRAAHTWGAAASGVKRLAPCRQ